MKWALARGALFFAYFLLSRRQKKVWAYDEAMSDLDTRIAAIEERNLRVEADKAWEISFVRRLIISVITYVTALFLLWFIGAADPALGALVPVAGFLLSTLSLSAVRAWWTIKK